MLKFLLQFIKKILPVSFLKKYESYKMLNKRVKFYNIGRYSYAMSPELLKPDTLIGDFCSIAQNAQIGPGAHPTNFLSTSPFSFYLRDEESCNKQIKNKTDCIVNAKPIVIDNDVWIGTNTVVMNGIHIGTGAVIGANAVVTRDVAPYEIVGGIPAKTIRYRFDDSTIKKILDSKWWKLPDEIVLDLPLDQVENSLKKIEYLKHISRTERKVIFIITSCIYPYNKPLHEVKNRSIYSVDERINQTKKTILSIRSMCPQAKILLIDNGEKNPDFELKKMVDQYRHIGGKISSHWISSAKNKSIGEIYILLNAIKLLNCQYDLVFKISGRYYLNEEFDLAEYDTNSFNFINYYQGKIVTGNGEYKFGSHSTRMYAIPGNKVSIYNTALKKAMIKCILGGNIEYELPIALKKEKFFYHRSLGLEGNIAIDGCRIKE